MGMHERRPGYLVAVTLWILVLAMITFAMPWGAGGAVSLTSEQEGTLAEKYAPTLYFHSGEEVFPVNVSYFIDNSNLNESVLETAVLLTANPTAAGLASYSNTARNFYLDDQLGTIEDGGIIDAYRSNESSLGYTVYSHVTTDGTQVAIQYWFFYVFNFGTYNDHEGDWEMIEIILDGDLEPLMVGYSQHEAGQQATWSQVEKSGDGPVAYVAKGSHANYFRSFQGKMGAAQDEVAGNGKVLRPGDYDLVVMGEAGAGNHPADQGWIDYSGRWGDWGNQTSDFMGQRGPLGPAYRMAGTMWSGLGWAESRAALDEGVLTLELVLSYMWLILVALLIVPLVLMIRRIMRKRKKGEPIKPLIYLLDFSGGIGQKLGNILAIAGVVLGLISAFLPFYEISANVQTGQFATDGYQRVLYVDGISGIGINTLVQGGVQQIAALPFPIWALIVVGLLAFIMSLVAQQPRRAGIKYISRGIGLLLPLAITVVVIGSLAGLLSGFNVPIEDASLEEVLSTVASNPLGGQEEVVTPGYGTVGLLWGIGIGAYALTIAGLLLIAGGVLLLTSRKGEALPVMAMPQESQI
jgi:hypothetical protein